MADLLLLRLASHDEANFIATQRPANQTKLELQSVQGDSSPRYRQNVSWKHNHCPAPSWRFCKSGAVYRAGADQPLPLPPGGCKESPV